MSGELTKALRQLRELVDVFAGVPAVWDAETKVKVEALQQVIAKIVSLNHAEVVQRLVSNCEFHPGWGTRRRWRWTSERLCLKEGRVCVRHSRSSHSPQSQEGRRELVTDESPRAGVSISVLLVFG